MITDQASVNPPLRQLSEQDFTNIISQVDKERYSEFYERDFLGKEQAVFENVEFPRRVVIFDGIVVNLPIIIRNSRFNEEFCIVGGVFNQHIDFEGGIFEGSLRIEGGVFQERVVISGGKFNSSVLIQGGTFHGYVGVQGGTFYENFIIDKGIFVNGFAIEDGTFTKGFLIRGGEFKHVFLIRGGDFKGIFFVQGDVFSYDFRIDGGAFNGQFWIEDGIFTGDFLVQGGKFSKEFWINGGNFLKALKIEGGTFGEEIRIKAKFIYILWIRQLTSSIRLQVDRNCQLNILYLNSYISKESVIRIASVLHQLIFRDFHNFGTVILTGISFREKLFVPDGFSLIDSEKQLNQTQLQFVDSDLGKTTFINCDLSGFSLHFDNSKITDVSLIGTQMPMRIVTPDFHQRQLGYSQIKKIYEARGDRVEANRYYAKEMEAYQQTLSWRRWKELGEKINLTANKISTNYGQSWGLGLLTTLSASAFFYWLYCYALGYRLTTLTSQTSDLFWQLSSYFPEFLNPIHKADYVADQLISQNIQQVDKGVKSTAQVSASARLIEALSRIFIAYFVYQLIQAFRKHGKASG